MKTKETRNREELEQDLREATRDAYAIYGTSDPAELPANYASHILYLQRTLSELS